MWPKFEVSRATNDTRWSDLGASSPTICARDLDVIHWHRGVRLATWSLWKRQEQHINLFARDPKQLDELQKLLKQIARARGEKNSQLRQTFKEMTGIDVLL